MLEVIFMIFKPEMNVVRFGSEDVIATSVVLKNFNDGDTTNNTFYVSGPSYVVSDTSSYKSLRSALSNDAGVDMEGVYSPQIFFGNKNIDAIYNNNVDVDGVYEYSNTTNGNYYFTKKQ